MVPGLALPVLLHPTPLAFVPPSLSVSLLSLGQDLGTSLLSLSTSLCLFSPVPATHCSCAPAPFPILTLTLLTPAAALCVQPSSTLCSRPVSLLQLFLTCVPDLLCFYRAPSFYETGLTGWHACNLEACAQPFALFALRGMFLLPLQCYGSMVLLFLCCLIVLCVYPSAPM